MQTNLLGVKQRDVSPSSNRPVALWEPETVQEPQRIATVTLAALVSAGYA